VKIPLGTDLTPGQTGPWVDMDTLAPIGRDARRTLTVTKWGSAGGVNTTLRVENSPDSGEVVSFMSVELDDVDVSSKGGTVELSEDAGRFIRVLMMGPASGCVSVVLNADLTQTKEHK